MLRVKGSDTLCPVGPGLVTGWDFHNKSIRTIVNGKVIQDGNTNEMEWDMHYLVADIARNITLEPGDLLLSGTPANSRPVQPGDEVIVEVEGLGALRNNIVHGPTPIREDVGHQAHDHRGSGVHRNGWRLGIPRNTRPTRAGVSALQKRVGKRRLVQRLDQNRNYPNASPRMGTHLAVPN